MYVAKNAIYVCYIYFFNLIMVFSATRPDYNPWMTWQVVSAVLINIHVENCSYDWNIHVENCSYDWNIHVENCSYEWNIHVENCSYDCNIHVENCSYDCSVYKLHIYKDITHEVNATALKKRVKMITCQIEICIYVLWQHTSEQIVSKSFIKVTSTEHEHNKIQNKQHIYNYQYHLNKLETIQKKAIRNISRAAYNEPSTPLFKKLNILKINDIYHMSIGKLMFSYLHKLLPPRLLKLFKTNTEIHTHDTRSRDYPHLTSRQTNTASRSFLHESPKFWSTLPAKLKALKTVTSFNHNMKMQIIQTY